MEDCLKNLEKLINCPVCGVNVLQHRLQKHLQKVHSEEAKQKRAVQHEIKARELAEGNRIVNCHLCKQLVKNRNLASHLRKVHKKIKAPIFRITTGPILKMGNGPSFSEVLAALESNPKKVEKELIQVDKKPRSTDPFDLGLTVSGGAFCNGRRR